MINNYIYSNSYFYYPPKTYPTEELNPSNLKPSDSPGIFEKSYQIGAKAIQSAVKVVLSSEATKSVFSENLDISATAKLGIGQFFSSTVRQTIDAVTESPIIGTIGHAVTQGLRNVYRGTSPVAGAIDGAGYYLTSQLANNFKDNGKETKSSIFTSIAGTYATEMTESFVACKLATTAPELSSVRNTGTNSFICAAALGKGAVTATFVSAFMIYGYFNQNPDPSPPNDNL